MLAKLVQASTGLLIFQHTGRNPLRYAALLDSQTPLSVAGTADFVFYLAFSTLLTHELDAIHKHEWRLLFLLRAMPDSLGRRAFVLIHIPLVAVLLWLTAHPDEAVRFWTVVSLDLFMVVHAGLHWRLSGDPKYEFNTAHSRLLIYGAAVLSLAQLGLFWLTR